MLKINLPYELEDRISFMIELSCMFKKLRNMEKEVLRKLVKYQLNLNYNVLIDYDIKVKIREELDISEYNFNNLISSLRKKEIIVGGRIKDSYLQLVQKDSVLITFNNEQ
jgi:hypothetical protein